MFLACSEHGLFWFLAKTLSQLVPVAFLPSRLPKAKCLSKNTSLLAFVKILFVLSSFGILAYLTSTTGQFFWVIAYSNFSLQVGQWQTFWVHSVVDCTHIYANIHSFLAQRILYSFTFLKFIFVVQLLFLIPYFSLLNSAVYFTVSAPTNHKSHIVCNCLFFFSHNQVEEACHVFRLLLLPQ